MSGNSGIVFLYKDPGITSFQSLSALKRVYATRKIGHTGTLDKFASGVMIVCVGGYTRLASFITDTAKSYRAYVRFGIQTDTLDPEGCVIAEGRIPDIHEIRDIFPRFTGSIMQAPPEYSAIHIDGKRAYERVRAGEELNMPERPVVIYGIKYVSYHNGVCEMEVDCSKGTYIRSLARDMGLALGTFASLESLIRTRSGNVMLDMCATTKDISANPDKCLHTGRTELEKLLEIPSLQIKAEYEESFFMGRDMKKFWFEHGYTFDGSEKFLVFNKGNVLVGMICSAQEFFSYIFVLRQ